jgi:ArsR family transcriptional regulator
MVNLLRGKKMSVGEIAGYFKLRQPTITHHLQYLKEAGVVGSERRGRRVYYFITEKCKKGECGLFI